MKLTCDEPLSNVASNFNLCHYTVVALRSRWELAAVLEFLDLFGTEVAVGGASPLTAHDLEAALAAPAMRHGCTLLHFSPQRKHLLWGSLGGFSSV